MSKSEPEVSSDPKRSLMLALAAWVVPGLGHFLLGRRLRALVFFALVVAAIVIGCGLEGKLYHPIAGRPLTWLGTVGSMGLGLAYWILELGLNYEAELAGAGFEYGTAFLLTGGLMNLLLVIDTWDIAQGQKEVAE
ncbi:MAG: DUF6677 family protein [Acidobacteriota bacterium]